MQKMMLVIVLLIAFDAAIVDQTYAPEVITITKRPASKTRTFGRGRMSWSKTRGPKVIYKVLTNVEEPPKLVRGRKNMQRGLRHEIKFTDKDDVRPKDDSEYRIRLSLDTTGTITNIEFVSGKKDDLFYSQLLTEIVKYPWKPAVDYGKAVNYVMPLMIVLKPRNNKKTYKIVVPKLLKVKTVF